MKTTESLYTEPLYTAIAVYIVSIVFISAAAESLDREGVFEKVEAREQRLNSGCIDVVFSFSGVSLQEPEIFALEDWVMYHVENASGTGPETHVIHYCWQGTDLWRILAKNQQTEEEQLLIRNGDTLTVRSGAKPNRKYLFSKQKIPELQSQLWPFDLVASTHIFPYTSGKKYDFSPFSLLPFNVTRDLNNGDDATGNLKVSFIGFSPSNIDAETYILIDESHDYTLLRRVEGSAKHRIEYGDIREVKDGIWLPFTCRSLVENPKTGDSAILLWESQVVSVSGINAKIPDEKFSIDTSRDVSRISVKQLDSLRLSETFENNNLTQIDTYMTAIDNILNIAYERYDEWLSTSVLWPLSIVFCVFGIFILCIIIVRKRNAKKAKRNNGDSQLFQP